MCPPAAPRCHRIGTAWGPAGRGWSVESAPEVNPHTGTNATTSSHRTGDGEASGAPYRSSGLVRVCIPEVLLYG
jgi:hypothetical protein